MCDVFSLTFHWFASPRYMLSPQPNRYLRKCQSRCVAQTQTEGPLTPAVPALRHYRRERLQTQIERKLVACAGSCVQAHGKPMRMWAAHGGAINLCEKCRPLWTLTRASSRYKLILKWYSRVRWWQRTHNNNDDMRASMSGKGEKEVIKRACTDNAEVPLESCANRVAYQM